MELGLVTWGATLAPAAAGTFGFRGGGAGVRELRVRFR